MSRGALFALAVLAVTCGPSPNAKLPNLPGVTKGTTSTGSGGVTESGGTMAGGGGGSTPEGSGGSAGTGSGGHTPGAGGDSSTGGRTTGTGGRTTGEDAAMDSRRDGPRDGRAGGDGGTTTSPRDAGRDGAGGRTDAGRDLFGRDLGGTGGIGGSTGRDASITAIDGAAASCYSQIVDNGYTCGTAAPCSECKDLNGSLKEAECQKGIDCLAAAGSSCNSSCQLSCLNKAGDAITQACIKALTTVACSGTGC
jgi:hypothetical protein